MSAGLVVRSRLLPLSARLDRRVPLTLTALGLLALIAFVTNIGTGEYRISPLDVGRALVGTGSEEHLLIVRTLRLPRALVAFLVGASLALAGAILQGLTRNPLASPDIIGVSAGASFAAVAVTVLAPNAPLVALPLAAFGGAAAAAVVVYALAWQGGSAPLRLILVGIGVAAVAHALTLLVITFGQIYRVNQAMIWMAGSVYGRSWEHLAPAAPWLTVLIPATLVMARHLDALHYGDGLARGLGTRVERERGLLVLLSVALAGVSVATAGTIGFVSLMAPHIARRLVGPLHAGLLPTAAMIGGALVLLADLAGRTIAAPIEIPCGIVTAVIGAPYFIYLLYRQRDA